MSASSKEINKATAVNSPEGPIGQEVDEKETASGVTRREFLATALSTSLAASASALPWQPESSGAIPRRTLGRTGEKVSIIGLGGFHIGQASLSQQDAIRIIRAAVDGGINFLDNCWDYNEGESERRMGQALRDGYRQRVFLMTKIDGRNKQAAARQIDESLARLQTDHLDLLQLHEIIRMNDPDRVFTSGGALEAVVAAKKAGKVRYIGFTGHKSPDIHLHMLETAAAHDFLFDTVQMPLNIMDAHFNSFEKKVLPVLVQRNIGVLGMKPLGSHFVLDSGAASATECLHYAMNLPTSVVITGCDSMPILEQALDAASTFRPMSESEVSKLLAKSAKLAQDGKYELYKTTQYFDGTAHHPQWLG